MVTERGGALSSLTIIDLSEGIAGPYAAMLFAQFGATVIKVEHPVRGDASRGWGPVAGAGGALDYSLTYEAFNACKLGLTLDYESPEGAAVLRRLAEDADGLIEDQPTRRRDDLGLGAEALIARIPRLVIVQVSGYGAGGPYASRPLTGLTLAASIGVLPPDAQGPAFDHGLETILGQNVFLAALAGLWRAAQTEHGQVVDVGGMPVLANLGSSPPGGASAPVIDLDALRNEGLTAEVEHPLYGRLAYPGAPFLMSETPAEPTLPAPRFGEHTHHVLEDMIEMEAAAVEELRSKGIV